MLVVRVLIFIVVVVVIVVVDGVGIWLCSDIG